MSLQLIIRCNELEVVQSRLKALTDFVELFSIPNEGIGISVPEKVLDDVGEEAIRALLASFETYDLYSGKWHRKTVAE